MDKVGKVEAEGNLRRWAAGILTVALLSCFLCGCSIEKVKAGDGVKPEYTVMKEEDFPDKVKELIEEHKETEFQLTYQDSGYLYLMKGYGKQQTGGYSIQIEDLSLWENAIHLQTVLIGPGEGEELKEEPSYPCLVVKMKYREEPVIFE
ncbi:MAG TPA: protease complex subunit PrcB family protein [Candidatus Blautia merdavium]|uniref:Protease complex subunit PrcB family protein n=1 Tax=Candidatus Blautia merdavium TaxID=2838494 RepID=A0A9D2T9R1_9FIRM|nr:protease complex subunit PrcB family protein [Candidatus Blautia merdavium]